GTFASRITGHGLMDNTDIAPIMEDFLGVSIFSGSVGIDNPTQGTHGTDGDAVMPNPVRSGAMAAVDFTTSGGGMATVEIFNSIGQRVRRLLNENLPAGVHHTEWNTADEHGAPVPSDTYMVVVRSGGDVVSRKLVVVR
ncbi:MAG: FlgD immunoglobulin-like domain containing protein, partial [Candidatus Kapaibacterium sp.]